MAKRKSRKRKCLLDTSVLYYLYWYDDSVRAFVETELEDYDCEITAFVRMEYLRGVILNLIDIYFIIKHYPSLNSAFSYLSSEFSVAKLRMIVRGAANWIGVFTPSTDQKTATLWRLGHQIFKLAHAPTFHHCRDRIDCELGKLVFPEGVFNEDAMFDFRQEFRRVKKSPDCGQCSFRINQINRLSRAGVDLYSASQAEKYNNKQYSKQAKNLERAVDTTRQIPSCRWCDRLGDSIISLLCPRRSVLVSSDRSFIPLCDILGTELLRLPSPREMSQANSG